MRCDDGAGLGLGLGLDGRGRLEEEKERTCWGLYRLIFDFHGHVQVHVHGFPSYR